MIGFAAVADHDAPLAPADGEIAEAHWIAKDQVRAILAGQDASFKLPGAPSIANVMVRSWAESD
jgi:NAD+ diphosphatase